MKKIVVGMGYDGFNEELDVYADGYAFESDFVRFYKFRDDACFKAVVININKDHIIYIKPEAGVEDE